MSASGRLDRHAGIVRPDTGDDPHTSCGHWVDVTSGVFTPD